MNQTRKRCKPVREHLYQIPVLWRQSHSGMVLEGNFQRRCLHVDSVGLFFYGKTEDDFRPDNIRRHLFLNHSGTLVIEAETAVEAITKFYNEIEGAQVGGVGEREKAIWIDRSELIRQLSPCNNYCWETDENWTPVNLICGGGGCSGECGREPSIRCYFHPNGNDQYTCEESPCEASFCDLLKHTPIRKRLVNFLTFKVVTDVPEPEIIIRTKPQGAARS